ncbi:MAG: rhomboid family intramembrane serine protease [Tannerella sp.]|jgi:membrane associated rhomboid family serine protease|nr:rhomboid family intramembrane serine protease [Tannerella sp.]
MISYLIIGTTVVVSFICFNRRDLFNRLSFNPYAIIKRNEWYRIITHGFVHADTTHLLVNMFTFWSFGTYMESLFNDIGFGSWGFMGLYFGGMIFASLYDLIKYRDNIYYQSIGASGAVSAVLFSSILFDPWGTILLFAIIPIPGIIFGVLYLLYCQYMAKHSTDNINHNAHFYGALYGLLFPVLLEPSLLQHFLDQILGVFHRL